MPMCPDCEVSHPGVSCERVQEWMDENPDETPAALRRRKPNMTRAQHAAKYGEDRVQRHIDQGTIHPMFGGE